MRKTMEKQDLRLLLPLLRYKLKNSTGQAFPVAQLKNSIHYFLEYVFIIDSENKYRLVVLHRGRLLTNKGYDTLKGAKIAFSKMFKHKAWQEEVKPEWARFAEPHDKPGKSVPAKTRYAMCT